MFHLPVPRTISLNIDLTSLVLPGNTVLLIALENPRIVERTGVLPVEHSVRKWMSRLWALYDDGEIPR